jgi:NADH-quinone oxidoreductase subunit I
MSLFSAIRDVANGFKSLLIGMRITAREAAQPNITVQYPHDTLPMPSRFRGHIKLVLDPATGKPLCTACTICERACPSGCIDLDGLKREGDKRKSVSKYMLDFTTCSLCGSCVEACPSGAIEFSKDYNVVSRNRDDFSKMDLFQKVESEAAQWSRTHPAPPAASTPAVIPAPTPETPAPLPQRSAGLQPALTTPNPLTDAAKPVPAEARPYDSAAPKQP